jgi:hypothetical protein
VVRAEQKKRGAKTHLALRNSVIGVHILLAAGGWAVDVISIAEVQSKEMLSSQLPFRPNLCWQRNTLSYI